LSALSSILFALLFGALQHHALAQALLPWNGWMQCDAIAVSASYASRQTHTWTLAGGKPTLRGAFEVRDGTWSVTGNGWLDQNGGQTWTINTPVVPASINTLIRASDGRRLIQAGHAQLRADNALTVAAVSTLATPTAAPLADVARSTATAARLAAANSFTVFEWAFPLVEDSANATTIRDSKQIAFSERLDRMQPAGVTGTATCAWHFSATDEVPPPPAPPALPPAPFLTATAATQAGTGSNAASRSAVLPIDQGRAIESGVNSPAASPPAAAASVAPRRAQNAGFTEALPTPGGMPVGGLRVRATSPTDAALHWSCVMGSTGYEVFFRMNGGESVKITATPLNPNCVPDLAQVNPGLLAPGSTPQTTYSKDFGQGGLTPGNDYTYVVRALYANGGPADSPPVTVRPLFPPPGFNAAPSNPGQVSISWDWARVNGNYAAGHVISRKLAGESAFRQLATVPYSPYNVYNDNGVPVGSHQYLVEAMDGEKGTPVTVRTGLVSIWQAWTQNIVTVDLGFSGVWPGGSVRVLSAPQATGPFTDITAEGDLSTQHWIAVAQFGSNLYYKVVVSYPGGITYEAAAQVAIPQASNIGLTAEDAGGGTRLKWNCETDVARYELLRRVGSSGPFGGVGGYAFTVYPKPGKLGGPTTCSYNDTTAPLGNLVEYVVIGFSSKQRGDKPIRAARTSVFVKS
jgi:hypothetical protein